MKKKLIFIGSLFILLFMIWTYLIQVIDVQAIGPNESKVGFATMNQWFHNLTGVSMFIYELTDYLSIIPFLVCIYFGFIGLFQFIQRKSIFKIDNNLIILDIYYVIVVLIYLLFEIIPINYRPILIQGVLEVSYPSSTTLLVLSVMPTLIYKSNSRFIKIITILFTLFMIVGRLISGVHWLTDIVGALLLSVGLFYIYISFDK